MNFKDRTRPGVGGRGRMGEVSGGKGDICNTSNTKDFLKKTIPLGNFTSNMDSHTQNNSKIYSKTSNLEKTENKF